MTELKVYDYLWVGEEVESSDCQTKIEVSPCLPK